MGRVGNTCCCCPDNDCGEKKKELSMEDQLKLLCAVLQMVCKPEDEQEKEERRASRKSTASKVSETKESEENLNPGVCKPKKKRRCPCGPKMNKCNCGSMCGALKKRDKCDPLFQAGRNKCSPCGRNHDKCDPCDECEKPCDPCGKLRLMAAGCSSGKQGACATKCQTSCPRSNPPIPKFGICSRKCCNL